MKKILTLLIIFTLMLMVAFIEPSYTYDVPDDVNISIENYNFYSSHYGIRIQITNIDNTKILENGGLTVYIPYHVDILTVNNGNIEMNLTLSHSTISGTWTKKLITMDSYIFISAFQLYSSLTEIDTLTIILPHNKGQFSGLIEDKIIQGFKFSYGFSFESLMYENGYAVGYDVGYNDGASGAYTFSTVLSYIILPFEILEKELAFGITLGHIALIPIVIGLMGFLFSIKGGKK